MFTYTFGNVSSLPLTSSLWIGILTGLLVISLILNKITKKSENHQRIRAWICFIIEVIRKPFILLAAVYLLYASYLAITLLWPSLFLAKNGLIKDIMGDIFGLTKFVAFFWFLLNTLNLGQQRIQLWLMQTHRTTTSILLQMLSKSLKAAIILLMMNLLIPELGLSGYANEVFEKGAKIALIGILAWLFIEFINGLESLILNQYNAKNAYDPTARKVNTQVRILKKVILSLVTVVTVAAILMVFESVKTLGTGLLTTAGIISAVGAFASQQSLGRIFAGLQIAFTQPIRLGDTVIIDKEFGQIEEITLSYIVVKLWDFRRLILPTDYFSNHGLQNLTRTSTELLGTIFFYVDFTLPIEPVRKKFNELIQSSEYWNKKVSTFQVTEVKEHTLELRALVSADDSGTLWNLRCEVREKLMKFIVDNYPQCLAKTRNLSNTSELSRTRHSAELEKTES